MPYDADSLVTRGRFLEDCFFLQKDLVLIEKLREMKRMEETKQALTSVSGIKNDRVLQRLIDLDIHPQILASLAVVPLVEVAWADGRIEEKERAAIMKASAEQGLAEGSPDHALLERWLTHRPEPRLLQAWCLYVEGLCEALGAEEKEALRVGLLDRARDVAEAAGGFLGLTSGISAAERRMLDALDTAFRK